MQRSKNFIKSNSRDKKNLLNENYNGENIIIETESVIIQLSKIDNQINQEYLKISSVYLGKCEDLLRKNFEENEDLYIYKTDLKTSDSSSRYVTFEIYDSYLNKLNLDVCKDVQIIIDAPVDFEDSFYNLVKSLIDSGYNIFNENDSFYNDIYSTYTNEYGVDMLLICFYQIEKKIFIHQHKINLYVNQVVKQNHII